jgi:hypothetical protein
MLLDSVLDENAIVTENVADATDALTECLVNVEEAYGEMVLEQAKDEFKQYVNEGSIEPISEGVLDSIKNFFRKLWNFIKKYWNKLKNWITGLNKNAYQYYIVNKEKINNGIKVTRFYGYTGLKNTSNISSLNDRISEAIHQHITRVVSSTRTTTKTAADETEGYARAADKAGAKNTTKDTNDELIRTAISNFKKAIIGSDSASTEESFTSILKDDIRGGSKETTLQYSKAELEAVLAHETCIKQLAASIKTQEAHTKDLENKAYGAAHAEKDTDRSSRTVNMYTQLAKIITSACNAAESMLPEVVKQADRYAHMAANGKSDDERKNESVDMSLDEAKSYLESIGLA